MGIWLGIDIGSVSVKLAAIAEGKDREYIDAIGRSGGRFSTIDLQPSSPLALLVSEYTRIQGSPLATTSRLLQDFCDSLAAVSGSAAVAGQRFEGVIAVGSGAKLVSAGIGAQFENEFKAIAKGVELLHPAVRTIFEMGGQCSKFMRLEGDPSRQGLGIADYETNGDCAAGTGSFMEQQATRLRYTVEEIGDLVMEAPTAARIAGRCSVFAKSDMIHAQQKGFTPAQILRGLCDAVARNFKSSITKGRKMRPPVVFIGGVAHNKGVAQALRELFKLQDSEFVVSPWCTSVGAVGAAALGRSMSIEKKLPAFQGLNLDSQARTTDFPVYDPLTLEKVWLLRNRVKPFDVSSARGPIDVSLGIDIGSVSTNLAVIDGEGNLLKEIYLRTEGRPIEQVDVGLDEIQRELGHLIRIRAVGTTGSGRELIGELVGADTVNDEITAHKTGAMYISQKLISEDVDTIFEIGGQDSKFISVQDGVVVDFAMNEACAAGTGSFLEEQAEKLGINIKGEFSELALRSKRPIRLGERCTVFMEQDVTNYVQKGAAVEDIVAGLAYSIALNYLNRVVRGRKIGNVIYFQGGTAYNDSVAAAFSKILGQRIIVPPHNGVVGAIGMALIAHEKIAATGAKTKFRGYNLSKVDYRMREFVCKACSNYCDIQEFNVEGEKTYWGDKCSDKFRKRPKVEKTPVIPDLFAIRKKLLLRDCAPPPGTGAAAGKHHRRTIGIPMTMSFLETLPFWHRFFDDLGFDVMLSEETNKAIAQDGLDLTVAEPCHPIKVAHGHVKHLLDKGADMVFLPNVIDHSTRTEHTNAYYCPWNMTLPFIIRSVPNLEPFQDRMLIPTLHFGRGETVVRKELLYFQAPLKVSRQAIYRAYQRASERQAEFGRQLISEGRKALEQIAAAGEQAIVLTGRVYNIYDKNINLDIPSKLRDYYSVNVIPFDFLPVDDMPLDDVDINMYWHSGRRILAVARFVRDNPNLHIIYITNFKCGPDSFVKHFVRECSGKPYLSLSFDGHSNDAGFMTRCEAYLDSKGFLQWWRSQECEGVCP